MLVVPSANSAYLGVAGDETVVITGPGSGVAGRTGFASLRVDLKKQSTPAQSRLPLLRREERNGRDSVGREQRNSKAPDPREF